MTEDASPEKIALARLAVGRAKRSALNALMRTPFYRLRLMGPRTTEVLFVPQDLRAGDPTFLTELQHDQMGLVGYIADLAGGSPFDVLPPSPDWAEQLHAFGWLRHLRAAREEGGDAIAKRLVAEWIGRNRAPQGPAFTAPVTARRILSWLTSAGMLLEDADVRSYTDFMRSLDMQLAYLASMHGQAAPGIPRLKALLPLVYAGLCLAEQERLIDLHEAAFLTELDRTILPSGAPVNRSSAGIVDLLLDILPMAQCYVARNREPPPGLRAAINRLFPWLRYMRLGDGQLARFNGAGARISASLATVLAYDDGLTRLQPTPSLGYLRADAGRSTLLIDVAGPPPLEASIAAHAGCLSFEMSSGTRLLVVNCGTPGNKHRDLRRLARSTAAHSTLAIEGASSARLVSTALLAGAVPGDGLGGPATVACNSEQLEDGTLAIATSHDGYLARFGVMHWRDLRLSSDGRALDGRDRLGPPDPAMRIRGDIPFGIHFHFHPDVDARLGTEAGMAELQLSNGERWRLLARGDASLTFADSLYLGDASGPRRCLQVVLRGRCLDRAEVQWRLERVAEASDASLRPTQPLR